MFVQNQPPLAFGWPLHGLFLFREQKIELFRGKMAFSSKNGSSGGCWNLSQNTQKMTIFGFKNGTESLLHTEIELRRCICVAHIPGYQNNTPETILEPGLEGGARFFKKCLKSPILAHFWSFLTIWTTCEPCKPHENGAIFISKMKSRPYGGPTRS